MQKQLHDGQWWVTKCSSIPGWRCKEKLQRRQGWSQHLSACASVKRHPSRRCTIADRSTCTRWLSGVRDATSLRVEFSFSNCPFSSTFREMKGDPHQKTNASKHVKTYQNNKKPSESWDSLGTKVWPSSDCSRGRLQAQRCLPPSSACHAERCKVCPRRPCWAWWTYSWCSARTQETHRTPLALVARRCKTSTEPALVERPAQITSCQRRPKWLEWWLQRKPPRNYRRPALSTTSPNAMWPNHGWGNRPKIPLLDSKQSRVHPYSYCYSNAFRSQLNKYAKGLLARALSAARWGVLSPVLALQPSHAALPSRSAASEPCRVKRVKGSETGKSGARRF